MSDQPKSPLREITQPFIDLVHAPRALWGINLAYAIEGMVYFGMLGYLAIYFSDFVFQGIEHADEYSHNMVMVLTAGITIAMFVLGVVPDKLGVRFALIAAFVCMLIGRTLISGAPNLLGLEPTRPGVFVGDKLSLHITRLETRDGNKAITAATVIANDPGGAEAAAHMALDLAAGDGFVPTNGIESRLVKLSEATVVDNKENAWEVEYGTARVKARLFAHAGNTVGLCPGAVFALDSAYVTQRDGTYVIRSHWTDDFGRVDATACAEAQNPPSETSSREQLQKPTKRWPVSGEMPAISGATPVTIAALRDMPDGPVDVVVRDACVTYVRNGGYFLQADKDSPAIFAFVKPLWSRLHLVTMLGMLVVVIGYGMYQPSAYAGVRQFTTPKTAAMAFAMLYALMNLGGWLPTFAFLLRDENFLNLGIPGTYWVYTGFTLVALLATIVILTNKTVREASARAKAETAAITAAESSGQPTGSAGADSPAMERRWVPIHMWVLAVLVIAAVYWRVPSPTDLKLSVGLSVLWVFLATFPWTAPWLARHPLADTKFCFFIFALIPVQTLFTYNWLILPQYISRAFEGWIGEYFEIASNSNPLLIFIAVPIITAISQRAKVYNMMVLGTFIMAAPAFLLALGPHWWTLFLYLLIMTIGEAMWQPRFLQYAAEIAPEGRTGQYMGVAQLPWFMTKMLVPWLYSGWMMDRYCPAEGQQNTQLMWLVFGCIAMGSTVLLSLAKGWIGKDFKTKA